MRMRIGTSVMAIMVLGAAVAAPASAATLADWEMNEAKGATVMVDSGPNHINGSIGTAVITGVSLQGATAYQWPFASPTMPPPKPERIIQVPNNSVFNPGTGTFIVTLRYNTTKHFGNIIQKGQAGAGAYFKLENPGGHLNCVFRGVGPTGSLLRKAVESPAVLSDGNWHTAVCTRTSTSLTLSIDGKVVATSKGSTGNITNTRPITIGGKLNCDQVKTTCDYFTGAIDYIKISN